MIISALVLNSRLGLVSGVEVEANGFYQCDGIESLVHPDEAGEAVNLRMKTSRTKNTFGLVFPGPISPC
jgi:hypothetical protein